MKFVANYIVSSHDLAHNNRVRPSALMRYMMETANRNMATQKPSYGELLSRGYAFVVSRTHLQITGDLRAYDEIQVETWAVPEQGASFDRCYRILRDGDVMAEAYSVFGLLNVNTGTLCRVGEVELDYYHDEPLALSTRFQLPKTATRMVGKRTIRYSDIDCNGHMNNTNYLDMLCDYIPDIDDVQVTDVYIRYQNEAPLGAEVTLWCNEEENGAEHVYGFTGVLSDGTANITARVSVRSAEMLSGF